MKRFKSIKVLGFICLILNLSSCSKDPTVNPEPTMAENFQEVLDNNLKTFNGKGISAAVVFQDQDVWAGTSGVSYGDINITQDMILGVGSATKTFIAALCLQLVEEEAFSLDDSLHEWLPDYPNIDSSITIQQLLYHTSCIYNITDNTVLWELVFNDPTKLWTPEELLFEFQNEPYAEPGSGWFYSNTNYILLGLIINEATGSSVSEELRNRFFTPLGLNNTFFDVEENLPSDVVHGWFDLSGNGSYDDMFSISRTAIYSVLWTSGAIFSTAKDLAIWSSKLFQGNVIGQTSLNQMLTPCNPTQSTSDVGCGMGVFIIGQNNNTGVELIGYTGRTFGYLTSMFYIPDYNVSVVVIINEDNTEFLDAVSTDLILEVLKYSSNIQ